MEKTFNKDFSIFISATPVCSVLADMYYPSIQVSWLEQNFLARLVLSSQLLDDVVTSLPLTQPLRLILLFTAPSRAQGKL
jgi:hypothetical protein